MQAPCAGAAVAHLGCRLSYGYALRILCNKGPPLSCRLLTANSSADMQFTAECASGDIVSSVVLVARVAQHKTKFCEVMIGVLLAPMRLRSEK